MIATKNARQNAKKNARQNAKNATNMSDRVPKELLENMLGRMSEKYRKICQIERPIECQKKSRKIWTTECQRECQKMCQIERKKMKNDRLNARGNVRRYMAERMSENMPDRMQERYDMQEKYGGNNFKTYVKTPRNHGRQV